LTQFKTEIITLILDALDCKHYHLFQVFTDISQKKTLEILSQFLEKH